MDLGPRWAAPAVALALVLGAGGTFLAAPASAVPPALHLAFDDDDEGDDDEGERPPVTRRTPPREDTAKHPPKAAADDDEIEGIPGLEARDPQPEEAASEGPAPGESRAPVRADLRVEETALSLGGPVGALVLLAIAVTGLLVGATFWLSRRYGP